jgi:ABC-2 type transport system permease protein
LGTIPVVLGKSTAYVFIYLFNALFTMYIVHDWFSFPEKGGFLQSLILIVPFLYTIAFLGLSISMFFRERVHSLMFMVFLSPIVLFFSGISWPAQSIPGILYNCVAKLFPSTTAIPAYIHLRVMGSGFQGIQGDTLFLLGQMVVFFVAACVIMKIKVKKMNPKPI